ncbi:MAG: VTT domain-containing protein [Planctomycetota bacterium]
MLKRQTVKQLGRPTALLAFAAAGPAVGGALGLGVAVVYADALRAGGWEVALLLVVGGFVGCGLWLLPTHVLSLVCGWALGWPWGAAVALGTATLAAPLGYVVGGKLAGLGALEWAERYPKGAAVCAAMTRASAGRAGWLVGLLRLSPVVPYGATNVMAAAFRVPQVPFLVGTALGLTPRVAAVAGLGAGLEQLEMTKPGGIGWVVLGVAATALMIASMGWITRGALRRAVEQSSSSSDDSAGRERLAEAPAG